MCGRFVHFNFLEAYYIEMDLRNLGGLNAAIGSAKANEVLVTAKC